jgi:hypothetical protein
LLSDGAPDGNTEVSMAQLMLLPENVRERIFDGTSDAVITIDQLEDQLLQQENRKLPPPVQVRYVPQFVRVFPTTEDDDGKTYVRGARRFHSLPRVLYTLTTEETLKGAVKEVRQPGALPSSRNPRVRYDKAVPTK